ncbi:DUF6498-containing protein [Parenemella sanctibonifatiensis]|uniref:Uncharacterized protein n=1 Tax=Parenemella sanctibonifatiensis TaxID=2016505 RepID=A0A255EG87_9ACTN|nr:DUF6498-containing protein [Parenemella sanctibonifatiensis]OYN88615.1 hypothetical protein CGZ91_13490 [Parenemella sanctibonifatiensis]
MPRTRQLATIGGIIALALVQAAGVLLWGWPVGNVLVMFWVENVIICVFALVQATSATRRQQGTSRGAWFRPLNYLFFCFVHGIFTAILAWRLGVDLGAMTLGLPLALLVIRYGVEIAGWAASDEKPTAEQAARYPAPRVVVLHVSIIVAWWLMVSGDRLFTPEVVLAILLGVKVIIEIRATLKPAASDGLLSARFMRGGGSSRRRSRSRRRRRR